VFQFLFVGVDYINIIAFVLVGQQFLFLRDQCLERRGLMILYLLFFTIYLVREQDNPMIQLKI